jgi:hypothetical protein
MKDSGRNRRERKNMDVKPGQVLIHNKVYDTVALRVQKFRDGDGKTLSLTTEIISRDEECVVMKATISVPGGAVLSTGHSEEYRHSSQINKTSALENAETSAIGRALAAFGLGGTEFATADEVAHAIKGKASATVASDVWDTLDTPTQIKLQGIADHARSKIDADDPKGAVQIIEAENLDADLKVALWSRFNSKERSAMKRRRDGG